MDGLVKHAGGRLRTTAYELAVLKGRLSRLQANLLRNAFWQVSLNLFGMRALAAVADWNDALGAVDDRAPVAGDRRPDAAYRASR